MLKLHLKALNPLRRFSRLPRIALTTAAPLPAKFRIRVLEPIRTEDLGEDAARDQHFIGSLAADVRALIQENLLEMVAARRSVWLG